MSKELPAKPALLAIYYDGDCGICSAFAFWTEKAFTHQLHRIVCIPYAAVTAGDRARGIDLAYADSGVQFIDLDGTVHRGDSAVANLLTYHASLRPIGKFLLRPGIRLLSALAYRLIASNRARISRWLGLNTCRVKPPGPTQLP